MTKYFRYLELFKWSRKKEKGENASLLTLEQKLCPRSHLLLPWQFLLGSHSFILGTSSTPGWMDGGGEGRIIHSLGSNHGGEEEGGEENITIKKGRRKGAKKVKIMKIRNCILRAIFPQKREKKITF